jgi:hypothetical protein
LRWLAYRGSSKAVGAFVRILRASAGQSHLAALGLGIVGKPEHSGVLASYARKADPVGRACAAWALTALRRPGHSDVVSFMKQYGIDMLDSETAPVSKPTPVTRRAKRKNRRS